MDGLANPYITIAAILGAGLQGLLIDKLPLGMACTADPAEYSEGERHARGIKEKLPSNLDEALVELSGSSDMANILGNDLISSHVRVKRAEQELLGRMDPHQRREWMIERY